MEQPKILGVREHKKKKASTIKSEEDLRADEERHRAKQLRRAQKHAERLVELGLDEVEAEGDVVLKYPVRDLTFTVSCLSSPVSINPVVTLIGVAFLWGLVFWSAVDPARALESILLWRSQVSLTCTWLFQCTKTLYFFFIVFITYRYGNLHLGRKDDKPDFSNLSYFAMILVAGVGNSLLFYCVSQPLFHQNSHFYATAGYRSQDEKDLFAVTMTACNWGFGSWATYVVVAICMSLAAYRFQLPMTYRTCFYPILGPYTWGWMGDLLDGMVIVVTMVSIFTSLGLGVMQIVASFGYMGWINGESSNQEMTFYYSTTVWVIIVLSTVSVIAGLHGGTPISSKIALALASLLMLIVFVMDDSKFLLNLIVQTTGSYLQIGTLQLNFWTDAFGQLREGSGRAIDGLAAEQWWMEFWNTFTQAWSVAVAAVVGMFIACISRGRKLGEMVLFSLVAPVGYCLVWFCVWGGIGLRQERQGMELQVLGEKYFNNTDHFLADDSALCYNVPQDDVLVDGEVVFTNYLPGVTPVCLFDADNSNTAVFNVLYSFSFPQQFSGTGYGPYLSFLFIFTCAMFFAVISDCSAFVVANLAANGRTNHHWTRRMFWLVTVGALTTTLLSSGGTDALNAVQAVMILGGLPFAILTCYMMQSITLLCQACDGNDFVEQYQPPDQPEFTMPIYGGIFNVLEYMASLGKVNAARVELGMHRPTSFHLVEFVKGVVVPFISLSQVLASTFPDSPKKNAATVAFYAMSYLSWAGVFVLSWSNSGLAGAAWALYAVSGVTLSMIRSGYRARFNLRSNAVGDLVACFFFWPQVLTQMRLQCIEPAAKVKGEDVVNSNVENDDCDDEDQDASA